MRPVKYSAKLTASIVANLITVFSTVVADHSTEEVIGDELPEGLSAINSLTTEEEIAKIISALVWEQFVFSLQKQSEFEEQLTFYFTKCGVTNEDIL